MHKQGFKKFILMFFCSSWLALGFVLVVPVIIGGPMASAEEAATYIAPKLSIPIPGFSFKDYAIVQSGNKVSIPFIGAYISAMYRAVIGIGVIVAAVMIVYGGFLYILGSSMAQISNGKDKIVDALVGLILLFGAYTILSVVNPATIQMKPLLIDRTTTKFWTDYINGDTTPDMTIANLPPSPPMPSLPPGGAQAGGAVEAGGSPEQAQAAAGQGLNEEGFPTDGAADRHGNKGCATSAIIKYPPPKAMCNSMASCFEKYCSCNDGGCSIKSSDMPPGIATAADLVDFSDLLPDVKPKDFLKPLKPDQKSILWDQYGLWFNNAQPGAMKMRPEAKAALLKAGKIAKSEGYVVIAYPIYREPRDQIGPFCQRYHDAQKEGSKGAGGLALPGASPHQMGVAADVYLGKVVSGKLKQITAGGPVCNKSSNANQVDNAVSMGLANHKKLDSIMARAGFRRMCSEMWHYDYVGVYQGDCYQCAFPPNPPKGEMQNCTPKYQPSAP